MNNNRKVICTVANSKTLINSSFYFNLNNSQRPLMALC